MIAEIAAMVETWTVHDVDRCTGCWFERKTWERARDMSVGRAKYSPEAAKYVAGNAVAVEQI